MDKLKLSLVLTPLLFTGCVSKPIKSNSVEVYIESTSMMPVRSNKDHLKNTIVNDYDAFQKVNYDVIKSNNSEDQLKLLNSQIEYVVMDLIANLNEQLIQSPIIIRPIEFEVLDTYKTRETEVLVETGLELTLKRFGFDVFNDRNPRGKLSGDESVLDVFVRSINNKVILQATLKYLDSNKIRAVKQIYITEYFFKTYVDGIEIVEKSEDKSKDNIDENLQN